MRTGSTTLQSRGSTPPCCTCPAPRPRLQPGAQRRGQAQQRQESGPWQGRAERRARPWPALQVSRPVTALACKDTSRGRARPGPEEQARRALTAWDPQPRQTTHPTPNPPTLEVVDGKLLRLAAALRREGHLQRARAVHHKVGGPVLVAKGVPAKGVRSRNCNFLIVISKGMFKDSTLCQLGDAVLVAGLPAARRQGRRGPCTQGLATQRP